MHQARVDKDVTSSHLMVRGMFQKTHEWLRSTIGARMRRRRKDGTNG